MKLTKEEFKKLQDVWYKRLAEHGFRDIEATEPSLYNLWYETYKQAPGNEFLLKAKQEYFQVLNYMLENENPIFRNEIDRYILTRYAYGARIKQIVLELNDKGVQYHRHSIRFIIRRYEMLWQIKKYNRKQLNLKPKISNP